MACGLEWLKNDLMSLTNMFAIVGEKAAPIAVPFTC